ncbi:hypothetical protein M0R45_038187 [Rubus argutus]|uniref:Uncharacterized protein n=1 Tax=Rubus argutus TaxID=59490 RepID=A0AAW1W4S7_RUBAR
MGQVLEIEIQAEQDKVLQFKNANEYKLLSTEFISRHGKHLIGTMTTWFLLDIAFLQPKFDSKDIFPVMHLTDKPEQVNALREVFQTSRAMFVIALLGSFPALLVHSPFHRKTRTVQDPTRRVLHDVRVHAHHRASKYDYLKIIHQYLQLSTGFVSRSMVTETKGRSLEEISGEDVGNGGENETQMTGTPTMSR